MVGQASRWLMVFVLCFIPSIAAADLVTQPAGLPSGAMYRIAFVTSVTRNATSASIGDYNTFVSNAANGVPALVNLGTSWTAIASTPSVDAIDNTSTPTSTLGIPIYRLDGVKLADDYSDLWDNSLDASLNVDQFGNTSGFTTAWTGSISTGHSLPFEQLGWPLPGQGQIGATSGDWIQSVTASSSLQQPFYGLSGVLVAVPEPNACLCVSAVGLVSLTIVRWKDRLSGRERH